MNRSLIAKIALRYLRGKGTANAVPILSRISMLAIAVSSCAMIILFSVFNGFEHLVNDMYKAFYPELKISAAKGKFFNPNDVISTFKGQLLGIEGYSLVIEDNVLVNTEEGDYQPVSIKGVDNQYFSVNDVKPFINKGNDTLMIDGDLSTAIIGQQIAANLGIDVDNVFARMVVYAPNPNMDVGNLAPSDAFRSMLLKPDGTFMVQEEFDGKYILVPLAKVQELLGQSNRVSSIELKLKEGYSAQKFKSGLQQKLGDSFIVASRYEQNKSVYMIMRSEKWAGYAILLFVLLIASFNMVSALSLLVLEKQKDMGILQTMGFLPRDLSKVILLEGILWGMVGGIIGLSIGLLLCWLQVQFKLVKIQGAFIIDAYPVAIHFMDVIVVFFTVALVGFLAAILPAGRIISRKLNEVMAGK
jgi:lipoprotein-releasing system permease protein